LDMFSSGKAGWVWRACRLRSSGLLIRENKIRRVVVREISEWKLERIKLLKAWKVGLGNDFDGRGGWAATVGSQDNNQKTQRIQARLESIWKLWTQVQQFILIHIKYKFKSLRSPSLFGSIASSFLLDLLLLSCTPSTYIGHCMLGLWIIPNLLHFIITLQPCFHLWIQIHIPKRDNPRLVPSRFADEDNNDVVNDGAFWRGIPAVCRCQSSGTGLITHVEFSSIFRCCTHTCILEVDFELLDNLKFILVKWSASLLSSSRCWLSSSR